MKGTPEGARERIVAAIDMRLTDLCEVVDEIAAEVAMSPQETADFIRKQGYAEVSDRYVTWDKAGEPR